MHAGMAPQPRLDAGRLSLELLSKITCTLSPWPRRARRASCRRESASPYGPMFTLFTAYESSKCGVGCWNMTAIMRGKLSSIHCSWNDGPVGAALSASFRRRFESVRRGESEVTLDIVHWIADGGRSCSPAAAAPLRRDRWAGPRTPSATDSLGPAGRSPDNDGRAVPRVAGVHVNLSVCSS
jgi:hypothetical protein